MNIFKTLTFILAAGATVPTFAADFSFDRPGSGFGAGITPVGHLAWEQGLPTATYNETTVDGIKEKTVTLNEDMLLRTGLTKDLELQLGWQGPAWYQTKREGKKVHDNGLGDISIGLKKAIDLDDDRLSMAILAQALIATGNDEFTEHDDIYSLSSAVAYQYQIKTQPSQTYQVTWQGCAKDRICYPPQSIEFQTDLDGLVTGVIYAINDRAQLDASVGVGLNGDDKNYKGGFGFSYLF